MRRPIKATFRPVAGSKCFPNWVCTLHLSEIKCNTISLIMLVCEVYVRNHGSIIVFIFALGNQACTLLNSQLSSITIVLSNYELPLVSYQRAT